MKIFGFVTRFVYGRCLKVMDSRECDVAIGGRENTYMQRWFIIPRNKYFNLYLHRVLKSDDARALHDHPWWSLSLCLDGRMREHRSDKEVRVISSGGLVFRSAKAAHRLELFDGSCVTLFATGPVIRNWGFHCSEDSPAGGWRSWQEFTNKDDPTKVGKGCGE